MIMTTASLLARAHMAWWRSPNRLPDRGGGAGSSAFDVARQDGTTASPVAWDHFGVPSASAW